MDLSINIDGGSRGNPGPAAAGVVITAVDSDTTIHEAGYFLGHTTNNIAEYQGLLRSLAIAKNLGARRIVIRSDSQLMVRQVNGEYRVKSTQLAPLFEQAKQQLKGFQQWRIQHVYRHDNQRADELVNLAIDAGHDVIALEPDAAGSARTTGAAQKSGAATDRPGDVPAFTVTIDRSACPIHEQRRRRFRFGPDTPGGLCVYAAKAVFDTVRLPNPAGECVARCRHCGLEMRIEPGSG